MPLDVIHRIDEPGFMKRSATHAEIHNVYGMENSRATYEGLLNLAPQERPFVMTRASFAGGQRYAVTWTGDNVRAGSTSADGADAAQSWTEWLCFTPGPTCRASWESQPELATRWFEIAAFHPIVPRAPGQGDRAQGTLG